MILSNKTINYIVEIYKKGTLTKKTQPLHALQYYVMCWHLRDNGVIKEDGLTKNGEKIWILTEKGNELAKLLKEIKRVLYGE